MKDKFYNLDDLPLMLRVDDLMVLMDVGRNTTYELLRCGRIRSVRMGKQLRVPKQAVIDYLSLAPGKDSH